jgi:hypothetical protein
MTNFDTTSLKKCFGCLGLVALLTLTTNISSANAAGDYPAHAAGDYPAHIAGVFIGATDTSTTDFTIGLEYEYKFTKLYGFGGVVEHIPDGHGGDGVTIAMGTLHLHPIGALRLTAGIGREYIHGANSVSHGIYRLGIAYDFIVQGIGIAPTYNLDFVNNKEVSVYGVAFTKHF